MSLNSEVGSGRGFPADDGGLKAEVRIAPDGDSPELLAARVDRYAVAHARALKMASYVAEQGAVLGNRFTYKFFNSLARKLRDCGEYLLFRHYTRLNKVRLHAAKFCQVHHLCPLCAIRRGSKLLRKHLERFALLMADNPKLIGFFVTLTVKDGLDIIERFQHLKYGLESLQKERGYDESRMVDNIMRVVAGGVGAFEFKRGTGSGEWHVHYHGIWLCTSELDKFKLSARWKALLGDSFIVDVRPLYGDSAVDAFLECFKYAVKFSDMTLEDNYEAFRVLSRCKLVRAFGLFRGIDVDRLEDEGAIPEDEPYIELMYRYLHDGGVYSFDSSHRKGSGGSEATDSGTPLPKTAENRS